MKKKLAVITTHPVQYNAPLFRMISERGKIELKVFYTWEKDAYLHDQDFGKEVVWDLPLLEGYEHEFVSNNGEKRRGFWKLRNKGLESKIEKWGADAVLVIGWNYLSHLRSMRYFKGKIPVYFRGDSTLLDKLSFGKELFRKILLTWVYGNIDRAFYVGLNNKEYFRKFGVGIEQLIFAPHAVDNERFEKTYLESRSLICEIKKDLGIKEGELVVLFAGKFQAKKNPLLLVEVFQQLNPTGAHLVLVGDGVLKEQIETLIRNWKNIHIIPFQNQTSMPAVYGLCDIICLPSKGPGETWGLIVNEAMACSKAVLVSDMAGCAPDMVVNGKNGYIFPSDNPEALKSRLGEMLSSGKLGEMGRNSREIVNSYSFLKIAGSIEEELLKTS